MTDAYKIPVLFLVFNRPGETSKVLDVIRNVKPAALYVAADGPRKGNKEDQQKCEEVRNVILSNINWKCNVKTLFRVENLGCKSAVSEAINWFFSHEEMGIILEDDCFADVSFFSFCAEMLHKYKDDNQIIAVNGCNFNFQPACSDSYFFSRYINVWGWATWRRAAKLVDYNMTSWNKMSKLYFLWTRLRRSFFDFDLDWYRYWIDNFDATTANTLDTWDYQWQYCQWLNRKKTIVASKNLVINVGFGLNATHTTSQKHPAAGLKVNHLASPIKLNEERNINKDYEEEAVKPIGHMFKRKPGSFYIKNWLLKFSAVAKLARLKKQSGL